MSDIDYDDHLDGEECWNCGGEGRVNHCARGKVQELATEFDCSDHIIWKIMNRKTWAHVPEVSLSS